MSSEPSVVTGAATAGSELTTHARILEAARRLFLEQGYSATSAGAIGNEVGISGPALYWHFSSKAEILFRLIEGPLADFVATIVSEEIDPLRRYAELARQYATFQITEKNDLEGYAALVSIAEAGHLLTAEHRAQLAAFHRQVYKRFVEALTEGSERGQFDLVDPVTTTFAVIAMCEHVHQWAQPRGRLSGQQIVEQCVALALRMAGARPS